MSLHAVSYTLRRAFLSFRESPFTTFVTVATIAISLFIFTGFLLLERNVTILLGGLGERIQIVLYLKDGVEKEGIEKVTAWISAQPGVRHAKYLSQEQAWRALQDGLGEKKGILDGLSETLLPPSIEVTLRDNARNPEGIRRLVQEWKTLPEIEDVQYGEEWISRLGFFIDAVELMKFGLGGLLFLATFLIVSNTIKLAIFARQDEIRVMKLVGATTGFVRAPFVVEGMIHGALGSALAVGGLALVYFSLHEQIPPSLSFLFNPSQLQFLDPVGIVLVLGWGIFLGGSGSVVSGRRFLGD